MTTWDIIAKFLQFVGFFVTVLGLWFSARGMRVVVSGRIDERRRSASSLKLGLPLLVVGILMLLGGSMLANWALLQ